MSPSRRPTPARDPSPAPGRGTIRTGGAGRLWERAQEVPERVIAERARMRQQRLDAAQTGLRPTWDLRLVPAAASAWGAALAATAHAPLLGQMVAGVARRPVLLLLGLALAIALTGAVVVLVRRRAVPMSPRDRSPLLHRAAPALLLCGLVAAAVVLRVGAQQEALEQEAAVLGESSSRVVLEVADRPVEWHGTSSSQFGPGPAETGEADSGVIVPVRLPTGASATLFADDPRWASVRAGQHWEAVVSAPQTESADLQVRTSGPPSSLEGQHSRDGPLETAAQRFAQAASAHGPDAAGLLPGMTYGDRSGLEAGLEKDMKTTGLTHLTAVSGSNCALVMALTGHLALGLGLRRRMCVLTGLAALALFVVLVGPDPSVLRAAVMGAVAALAVLSGRGPVSLAALSTAMCALLVIDPSLGREYGFALSVCATAGIVVTGGPLTRLLEHAVPSALALVLAIPLVAQLWCGPVIAMLTPTVAAYAVPANALAAPAVPAVTVIGLSALILLGIGGPVGTWLGELALHPGAWTVGWIARTARFFAGLPGSTAPWPQSPAGPLLMLALSLVVILAVHRLDAHWLRRQTTGRVLTGAADGPIREAAWLRARRRERAWRNAALAVIAVGAVAIAVVVLRPTPPPQGWSVIACDVGQGDAVLLRGRDGPQESTVLIDAGPDPGAVHSCLSEAGVQRLDLLVLTHDHADHVAGAQGLGAAVQIDQVWWSSASGRAPEELDGLSRQTARPEAGRRFEGPGLDLQVLAPQAPAERIRPESEDENNASLVLRAEIGEGPQRFSLLSAGDLEESGAAALLRSDPRFLDVDLLKLSHHGARNGGTAIIDAASPTLAVVSVGEDNDYGHPHPSILEHLDGAGIPVARTDENGSLAIRWDHEALVAVPAG